MFTITFPAAELVFAAIWLLTRLIVWKRQGRISWKREAVLFLMFINLAVIIRYVFFPRALADGHVQPLVFDPATAFPFRMNLVPFVLLFDYDNVRDMVWNVADNMAMFISAYYHFKYDLPNAKDFFEEMENDAQKTLVEAVRHWIALNEDMRFSNRYQVEMYNTYKTYRKLLQHNPEVLYQMEHLRWCAERSITGYLDAHKQGIKSNKDDFQILNLLGPYDKLPKSEKLKDRDVLEIMDKVIKLSKDINEFNISQLSAGVS